MYMKKFFIFLLLSLPLMSSVKNLRLSTALEMLEKNNLELKISKFNEQMRAYEVDASEGHHYGKLDLSVSGMRSNDAGNVFGFKLQSRDVSFGDFGFSDFDPKNPNILSVQPRDLNHPQARNHFETKVRYTLPLYTGGKLTEYGRIAKAIQKMSQFDIKKVLNEKIFQTKKAFYDISLIENYILNLSKIIKNITRLEDVVGSMKKEGYAQEIDKLEVEARKAEVESMYNQAKLNKDLAYQFLSFILNEEVHSIKKVNDMAVMPLIHAEEVEDNNLDIQKAILGVQITEMSINVAEAGYLPTVGAFGEYGIADNTLWNHFSDQDFYTVGVQLTWNIFSGGIDEANLEKSKVNNLKVQSQVLLAKSGIALRVKRLETEVLSKNNDLKSYSKQLKFARKVYENYRVRYQEGIVPISDVLIRQSRELEILLKLLSIKNERNSKIFEINSIINGGEKG